jgi:AmmeMemoRadiSam system protein B
MVRELLALAGRRAAPPGPRTTGVPAGILVPHAGLVYSGAVAASAWRLPGTRPEASAATPTGSDAPLTVILLGTNHGAAWLSGIGVWESGAWRTPLGEVPVDEELAAGIVGLGAPFLVDRAAHQGEHSIEVQLPLLQVVAPDARILPLAVATGIGAAAIDAGMRLGELIARLRLDDVRLVLAISSDMAHYPAAAPCERATETLLPSILAVDPEALAADEVAIRDARIRGLVCGMCGIEPAVVGLAALRAMGATSATRLDSATSADAGGPDDRTVGYLAVRFDEGG